VERYRQGRLQIRPHRTLAILLAESSRRKTEETSEGNDEFSLTKYICSYLDGIFNIVSKLLSWGRRSYFLFKVRRAANFHRPGQV
jgi:hypothetical protein